MTIEPGHYWAQWTSLRPGTRDIDAMDGGWEVVQVFANDFDNPPSLLVFVPGVQYAQLIENFNWGERVKCPHDPSQ